MIKRCPKCRREYETTNTLCPVDGNVLERVGDPLEGQVLADKYRIEERLSAGGMGAVYRATHVLMDKKVAVKVLHPALASDDQIVQRFTREARAASRISHPHALNVTDFGEAEGGVVFLVMEYLRGRTLKELIREEGVLPLPRAVEIMRQVAGALDAAHAEGVVHRDLKSDNIMLEEVGGHQDWAKVLDFGIAKIQEPIGQDPALTAPNLVIGTPQYMSPEQCSQSANIDKRSDIYSLGIILYEMLTGRVPFTAESPTAIMVKQLQDAPPSARELVPEIPVAVDEVIQRALAKKPEERFESAGEFAESLAQAAGAASAAAPTIPAGVIAVGDTNQVLGTTASNDTVLDTASTNAVIPSDELTVVSAERVPATTAMPASLPAPSINPWVVMVPAALLLVAVIGLAYAFSGNSNSATEEGSSSDVLRADPNGQPVQPTTPGATGESERLLVPGGAAAAASPAAGGNASRGSSPNNPIDSAPVAEGSPVVVTDENANAEPANDDTNNDNADPSPSPANRNTDGRRPPVLTPPANSAPANSNETPPLPGVSPSPRATPTPRRRTPQPTPAQSPAPEPPASGDRSFVSANSAAPNSQK